MATLERKNEYNSNIFEFDLIHVMALEQRYFVKCDIQRRLSQNALTM